jgi:hypothetical protein
MGSKVFISRLQPGLRTIDTFFEIAGSPESVTILSRNGGRSTAEGSGGQHSIARERLRWVCAKDHAPEANRFQAELGTSRSWEQSIRTSDKLLVCYFAVTASMGRFCQNVVGPARPPPALRPPDNSSIGCADRGGAKDALGCRRSVFAQHCGSRTAFMPCVTSTLFNTCQGGRRFASCAQIMRLARTALEFGHRCPRRDFAHPSGWFAGCRQDRSCWTCISKPASL